MNKQSLEVDGKMEKVQGGKPLQRFLPVAGVLLTAIALIILIYYTETLLQWTPFLTGIMLAAILALFARADQVKHLKAQLVSVTDELDHCEVHSKKMEEAIAQSQPQLNFLDEVKPLMVAYIDADRRFQYHNHGFGEWLNLRPERINFRLMREVLGNITYMEISAAVRQTLEGIPAHYELKKKLPDGTIVRASTDQIPLFAEDGNVRGFYLLATLIPDPVNQPASSEGTTHGVQPENQRSDPPVASGETSTQALYVSSFSESITGHLDEGYQILVAIEHGEFSLFCQQIISLSPDAVKIEHYEILLRLQEEEKNMMPPGAFFPLAEQNGLMPYLDRWVVKHVIEFIVKNNIQQEHPETPKFFINMSLATLVDPGFPEFLERTLQEYCVPGSVLCFEIPNAELSSRCAEMAKFAQDISQCGCAVALSGFGRDRVSFDLICGFKVDYLKIDGSIILDILSDPVKLAKVVAINRVARKVGMKTIAELVESEEIIVKLTELGIDFAQGFGISHPRPLAELG